MAKEKVRNFIVDFAKVKRFWLDGLDGEPVTQQHGFKRHMTTWAREDRDKTRYSESQRDWNGNSAYEMREYIREGYYSPHYQGIDAYSQDRERQKSFYSEEGDELDLFLAWSGDPTPFLATEERPAKPGMRIVADFGMACTTSAETIEKYGQWLAGLCGGLEASGFDLEVDVSVATRALFQGERGGPSDGPVTDVMIRLKKVDQQTDYANWSPMFAPGGYRILGFSALWMAADQYQREASGNLGYPLSRTDWAVDWDESERTLKIWSPNTPRDFPRERMDKLVKESGAV